MLKNFHFLKGKLNLFHIFLKKNSHCYRLVYYKLGIMSSPFITKLGKLRQEYWCKFEGILEYRENPSPTMAALRDLNS